MRKHPDDLAISVLEAVPVGPGVGASQAYRWAKDVAQMADRTIFKRLWAVEHHAMPDIGSSAPSVLLAYLASITSRIRLGSGGVMLPNHAPMVVAEQFSTLEAIEPGRFDLGIGAAIGGNPKLAKALRRQGEDGPDFLAQLDELSRCLGIEGQSDESETPLQVSPSMPAPPVFLLGASERMARLAASKGMGFAYAGHLKPEGAAEAIACYRREFVPVVAGAKPYAILTRTAIAAETEEEAHRSAMRAAILRVRAAISARSGMNVPPEVLLYPEYSEAERDVARKELTGDWISVGSGQNAIGEFHEAAKRTDADEIMITSIEFDGRDRIRTLGAIAAAAGSVSERGRGSHAYA